MRHPCSVFVMVVGLILAAASTAGADSFATTGGKWGDLEFGTGAIVTYSFMKPGTLVTVHKPTVPVAEETVSFFSIMPPGWKHEMRLAFAEWSAVANIRFIEVPDQGEPFGVFGGSGDIRIGNHLWATSGVLAHGVFPPVVENPANSRPGDIHFKNGVNWVIGFGDGPGDGIDIRYVMAHELGHAIGLGHTTVPLSLMNRFYQENFRGPQADDIAGAQFIYGLPVPEPAAASLLLLGVFVLGVRRRRRS